MLCSADRGLPVRTGITGKALLEDSPNYATADANRLRTIRLTACQIAVIADMFSWSMQNDPAAKEKFERSLAVG